MIRIDVSDAELLAAIEQTRAGWIADARRRTGAALRNGRIGEGEGSWSAIKEVYILRQEFKCIYCEFPLPKVDSSSADRVAVDYDVEHYRPKNRVTAWPTPEVLTRRPSVATYQPLIRTGSAAGYLRLAFDPFNYVVACKVCNSSYKADRFPIAGAPDGRSRKRASLDARERPLLLFPFGTQGDDPGRFLAFDGAVVRPRRTGGPDHLRGRVVIDFFELDTREGLLELRCILIQLLWKQLRERDQGAAEMRAAAEAFLRTVMDGHRHPHTACGRAFIALYDRDQARARAWADAALHYLISKDPAIFTAIA
jgi:hypothetical protein